MRKSSQGILRSDCEKGFNQSLSSRTADVSFIYVKRILRNPYKGVTTTTLEKIARALHVKVADLIEEIADSDDQENKAWVFSQALS